MSSIRKTYVQVGVGARSGCFTRAVTHTYADTCRMAAICDTNRQRMAFCNERFGQAEPMAMYTPDGFDRMLQDHRPDIVIVSSVDSTHADYICRALAAGCDVITEKPLTTDAEGCRRILCAMRETGRDVRIAFNARYVPCSTQMRELLAGDVIGDVAHVNLRWELDTRHGADYFRRWHRRRALSGSLLVHKATHHFDLVNWWLGDVPEEVFAHGSLRFYRPETAERLGLGDRGERCRTCACATRCPFFRAFDDDGCRKMYTLAETEDGYLRDRCVFDSDIDIWDTMSLTVRYARGAIMTYSLCAFAPAEGYRVSFTGTRGRLERTHSDRVSDSILPGESLGATDTITRFLQFGEPVSIEPCTGEGGHGGGDPLLLADLFSPDPPPDPFGRRAACIDGVHAALVGIAAGLSIDSGRPVKLAELLD
jgi:predicted dehydrogenase